MKTPSKAAAFLAADDRGARYITAINNGLDEKSAADYAGTPLAPFQAVMTVALKAEASGSKTKPALEILAWLTEVRRARASFQLNAISLAQKEYDTKTVAKLAERVLNGRDSEVYWDEVMGSGWEDIYG